MASAEDPRVSRPPWWLTIVVGALLAAALSAAGWAVTGVIDLRDQVTKSLVTIEYLRADQTRLEVKLATAPVQSDIDSLRREMQGLSSDLKDLRAELRERRR